MWPFSTFCKKLAGLVLRLGVTPPMEFFELCSISFIHQNIRYFQKNEVCKKNRAWVRAESMCEILECVHSFAHNYQNNLITSSFVIQIEMWSKLKLMSRQRIDPAFLAEEKFTVLELEGLTYIINIIDRTRKIVPIKNRKKYSNNQIPHE